MTMYLCHAKAGREFEVTEAIAEIATDAWCARKAQFVRRGNDRRPKLEIVPYLPNAVFADFEDDRFHLAARIKYLARTLHPVGPMHQRGVQTFLQRAEAELEQAKRIEGNRELIAQFKAGEAIKAIRGPFHETALQFLRMVDRADMLHPKIVAEARMMGQTVEVQLDPLDVRAAG